MKEQQHDEEDPSTVATNKTDSQSLQMEESSQKVNSNANADAGAKELATSNPSLRKLIWLAAPEFPMLALALVFMVGSESTGLITPLILARAYNVLIDYTLTESDRMSEINHTMILVVVIFMSGILASFLRASILGVIGERVVARLRLTLYSAILKQEIAFFDDHESGELTSRLSNDTTLLQTAISQSIPESLIGLIKVIVSIGLMFWISTKLSGCAIGSIFLVFVISVPFGTLMARLSKEYQYVLGQAQTRSTEALGAMRTVQAFAAELREVHRFERFIGNPAHFPFWWPTNTANSKSTYSVGFFKAMTVAGFFTFIFGFGFGFLYLNLWYGFRLVLNGDISLGDLTAFQSYIFTIGFGLGTTSTHLAKVLEAAGASGRVFYLMERVPAIPSPRPAPADQTSMESPLAPNTAGSSTPLLPNKKPDFIEGVVEFQNVNFSYASRHDVPVLVDYCLKVPANTTAALVGSSGAGKSTVVSLLQRFYDIDSGRITIDGHDIRDLDVQWLRRHIGYVQQEPHLFGLTVKENILYGVQRPEEISQEEIERVCIDANAHDFIMAWPQGYDTLVGERGVKLSGGQKQRLAIARALLTNCRILLLDEATSALDAESEHLVQEAIDKVVVGRTVIIVAHRLSTIRRASQIVVMDNHKIVDVGTHEDLLSSCEKYKDLIKRQSMIRIDDDEKSSSLKHL